MESNATNGGETGEAGGWRNGASSRTYNGGEQMQATPWQLPYGLAVVQSVADSRHRPGMIFMVKACEMGGMKEEFLSWWWSKMSASTRRKRLHGWRMWHDYCVENDYTSGDLVRLWNPVVVVSDFVGVLESIGTALYLIKESLTAVKSMYEILNAKIFRLLQGSPLINDTLRLSTSGVRRVSRYRTMWKLRVLLEYIRKDRSWKQLTWYQRTARAAALFMIFIPCRTIGAWRINCDTEVWSADGLSVDVTAKEKTDYGRGTTAFLIRACKVTNLCPLTAYRLLKAEASKRGAQGTLWCTVAGKPYKQASFLSRLLKGLLREAGIPAQYTAYSIRHALITALFEMGLNEVQVNAYTGHSNNAHTALTHYFHLDEKWVGHALVPAEMPVSPEAEAAIQRDNMELQSLLHFGEEDTGDAEECEESD